MDNNGMNIAAIETLINGLTTDTSFNWEEVRLHCRTILYSCFILEIEPHQLPLSEHFAGTLSACQKRQFLQEYLSLYLETQGERYRLISKLLENEPAWSYLLKSADTIIEKKSR